MQSRTWFWSFSRWTCRVDFLGGMWCSWFWNSRTSAIRHFQRGFDLSIPHWEESLILKPDESQFCEGPFREASWARNPTLYGFMPDSSKLNLDTLVLIWGSNLLPKLFQIGKGSQCFHFQLTWLSRIYKYFSFIQLFWNLIRSPTLSTLGLFLRLWRACQNLVPNLVVMNL